MLCGAVLAPFWGVDMRLPHLNFFVATDASSEYGLGGCTAHMSPDEASELLKAAERDGTFVTLAGVVDKPRSRSLGTPHPLKIGMGAFTAIFSIECSDSEHINLREARVVLHYVRWLLRARARHNHRVLLLVDSKIVVGALGKGRSGSPSLNNIVRRIACLCFAGGIRLHIIYIPTEHNPADYPSRGARLPGRRHRPCLPPVCPECGVAPHRHPLHVPRRRRGQGLSCGGRGFAHIGGDWVSQVDLDIARIVNIKHRWRVARAVFKGWVEVGVACCAR